MEKRKEFWRALPFVMALLLLTLVPAQSASALFGKGKEEAKAVDGAPVAENMEIKVYGGRPRLCLHAGRQAGDGQLHLHGDRRLRQHLAARDGEHHNRKGK